MKNGLVSIIIPVHNSEKYLKECIKSAINQTYSDIEIIAVDDGYPDNSLKILNKFSNEIIIIKTKSCNIASARNQGIENSNGEWIKFLDSDDVLYPNAIIELVSVGKNIRNKKNTILYSNFEKIDSKGKKIKKFLGKNYNDLDQFAFNSKLLFFNFLGHPSSSLIHKSTITSYGMYNEKFNVNEDWELWLRYCILYNCRMHLVPKLLVKYRKHPNSLTSLRRKNLPKSKIGKSSEKTKEFILSKLDPSLREKYEIALRQFKKEQDVIKNELEESSQNLIVNQKKIKELSGLDVTSKTSLMKTCINFLYHTFTINQKINRKLINENKDLREKIKELKKSSQKFLPHTLSD